MAVNYSELSTAELLSRARRIKAMRFGPGITFSPKVFIPLTMLCRDRCGYCTFAKTPPQVADAYLSIEQVLEIALEGEANGCTEALFTLGEKPEERYSAAADFLGAAGLEDTVGYLYLAAKTILDNTGLIPHINAGALSFEEILRLKKVSASQGMMIESLNPTLEAHRLAPDKAPERRIASLIDAGKASVPFTTGILVGIGESEADRILALEAISEIAARSGHIQEVIVQNFLPKPRTRMSGHPPATREEFIRSIALARLILPPDVHLQAPPNLSNDIMDLVDAGIDDLGGISPVTVDHVNPERPWPHLGDLEKELAANGVHLVPRLPIYPEFNNDRWLSPELRFQVTSNSDSFSYARPDSWVSGGDSEPPQLVGSLSSAEPPKWALVHELADRPYASEISEICTEALRGKLPTEKQIEKLFTARGWDLKQVVETADKLRHEISGDVVTFVANRNINYTNVCTFKCRFCAFSKGPLSLNLRGNPYLLELSEVTERVAEAAAAGATEVCLQGGIHPSFDGDYYLQILEAVKKGSPSIHIHGFSALEIHEGAKRLNINLEDYLTQCKDAGLKSLPGTAAEILDDEVRKTLCPDKIGTERWLEVHQTAHRVGLRSNITIMFGSIEDTRTWAKHLVATRTLQEETHGFTEFVPLPFVHMASPIYLQKKARKGPTFREALLMHAIARISYQHLVPNIQTSWVKMGIHGARQLLQAGTNDLGGTLMGENISRAAGAVHGQELSRKDFEAIVFPLKRPLAQRTTLYEMATPN